MLTSISFPSFNRAALALTASMAIAGPTLTYALWEDLPKYAYRQHRSCHDPATIAAVVFTGSDMRISEGLNVLRQGKVFHLLVSGDDEETIRARDELVSSVEFSGRVTIDQLAVNTKENAANTAKWLTTWQGKNICAVELVTSATHMPRSAYLLSEALAANNLNIAIRPHPIRDSMSVWVLKRQEIGKMGLTMLFGIEERDQSAYPRRRSVPTEEAFKLIP